MVPQPARGDESPAHYFRSIAEQAFPDTFLRQWAWNQWQSDVPHRSATNAEAQAASRTIRAEASFLTVACASDLCNQSQ